MASEILADRKFMRKGWYLRERHDLQSCVCSYCTRTLTMKLPFGLWSPSFRYWLAGWWVFVRRRGNLADYRRITL